MARRVDRLACKLRWRRSSRINDPLGGNPRGTPFTNNVFTLYDSWTAPAQRNADAAGAAIARGQAVFNTKPIAITGVAGINDALGVNSLPGFCGTCRYSPMSVTTP